MAPAEQSVVVRIAYDGPPTSGKTTSLRKLAHSLGQPSYTPAETAGRTLYFDWLEYVGGRFEGRDIRCLVVSVPGQPELTARRHFLLRQADAVIFVGDTSAGGMAYSLAHLEGLREFLRAQPGPPVGLILQANKRDLPNAVPLEQLRAQWSNRTGAAPAVIESVAEQGLGIRETFVFAVRLALDRVRQLSAAGSDQARPPELSEPRSGPALYRALQALPLEPAEIRPPPSAPESAPRLPHSAAPSGWVWPPVDGRLVLHEATAGAPLSARRLSSGDWVAGLGSGWRLHSAASDCHAEAEVGRTGLIRWARVHASWGARLSSRRCLAMAETGQGGYRLWQIVRAEPSLFERLAQALSEGHPQQIAQRLAEAVLDSLAAGRSWRNEAMPLPLSLESLSSGLDGPLYIGLMPPEAQSKLLAPPLPEHPSPDGFERDALEALSLKLEPLLQANFAGYAEVLLEVARRHASQPLRGHSVAGLAQELEHRLVGSSAAAGAAPALIS